MNFLSSVLDRPAVPKEDRVVIVMSAGSCVGRQIGLEMASDTTIIGLADTDGAASGAAAKAVAPVSSLAVALEINPIEWASMTAGVQKLANPWSRLDVMVNVCHIRSGSSLLGMTEDEFDALADGALTATIHGVRAAADVMLANGNGCIVNVFLTSGDHYLVDQSLVEAGKMLTRAAAVELAPSGIRVVGVSSTYMHGSEEGVAEAVSFLSSAESTYVTGTTLVVGQGDALCASDA